MLIDWFTVAAQGVNFVILVWLLKHFLFKPILGAIDAREKHIAAELADADLRKTEARKERDDFQNRNKVFDEQRDGLLAKATADAGIERDRLIGDAHKRADALSSEQATVLRSNLASLSREITRQASEEVFAISRKALSDLATVSLEERMGEVFTRRVHQLDGKAKETLGAAIWGSSEPVVVRSTFDMPSVERAAIQNALNETFSMEVRIRYETDTATLCGIELSANGQKVSWSIADYVGSLERRVDAIVDANSALNSESAVAK
jgi:F-type H+-transporting ATPase subunit b